MFFRGPVHDTMGLFAPCSDGQIEYGLILLSAMGQVRGSSPRRRA